MGQRFTQIYIIMAKIILIYGENYMNGEVRGSNGVETGRNRGSMR